MVTIRSSDGMYPDSTLSRVVLPLPVPPLTMMFARAETQALRKPKALSLQLPSRIRSAIVRGPSTNLRMLSRGPSTATGGIATCTREPSTRRASHNGFSASIRLPTDSTMRRITTISSSSLAKLRGVSRILPPIST